MLVARVKCRLHLQKVIGHVITDANMRKVASLAQRLFRLQASGNGTAVVRMQVNKSDDDIEFGADLVFHAPARFLVEASLEDGELLGEESTAHSSFQEGLYDRWDSRNNDYSAVNGGSLDLRWLRDACDVIVKASSSQLSRDDLAMAICRVLDSDKPGDEVLIHRFS